MVGELLDILEADDAAVRACDGGVAGRGLMNLKGADRLEGDARPAGLKGAGAHVVGAAHDGGGEQERILQRHAAELCAQAFVAGRRGELQGRLDLVVQTDHQRADRNLARAHAGRLAGSGTAGTGIGFRKAGGCCFFIVKPDAAQMRSNVEFTAGSRTGCVLAQRTADHVRAEQDSFKHDIPPCGTRQMCFLYLNNRSRCEEPLLYSRQ